MCPKIYTQGLIASFRSGATLPDQVRRSAQSGLLPIDGCLLIWLILHQGVRYEECGRAVTKESKQRRTWKMIGQLRELGYRIESPTPQPNQAQAQ